MVPGLKDLMEIKVPMADPPSGVIEFAFGAGTDAYFKRMGRTFTVLSGRVYVTQDTDTYLDVALEGDLERTRNQLLGGDSRLPVQFAMRAGKGLDAYVDAINLGSLKDAEIVGHRMIKDDSNRSLHEITFEAANGKALVHIDAKTHFVSRLKLEVTAPGAPEGGTFTAEARFNPQVVENVRGLIRFDPTGRRLVKTIRELKPTPIRAGDDAFDFTLETVDGDTVTLSRLRGSVVVLDFWATWCAPCRKQLPLIQEFATWAESSGHPIKVYGVNVYERGPCDDEKKKQVIAFLKSQGVTMPTLLDLKNTVAAAYGSPAIPVAVIVDSDGTVAYVHSGSDPDLVEILKKEVQRILPAGR